MVEYRKVGWTAEQLTFLLARMGKRPAEILRLKGASEEAVAAAKAAADDNDLIVAMVAFPELVERPIVAGPKGAMLCRPVETVVALL